MAPTVREKNNEESSTNNYQRFDSDREKEIPLKSPPKQTSTKAHNLSISINPNV